MASHKETEQNPWSTVEEERSSWEGLLLDIIKPSQEERSEPLVPKVLSPHTDAQLQF